jgi:hypothetical protein
MEKSNKLLASAPTLERIKQLTSQYLYGSTVTLVESGKNKWEVHTLSGKTAFAVIKRAGRYRLENSITQ